MDENEFLHLEARGQGGPVCRWVSPRSGHHPALQKILSARQFPPVLSHRNTTFQSGDARFGDSAVLRNRRALDEVRWAGKQSCLRRSRLWSARTIEEKVFSRNGAENRAETSSAFRDGARGHGKAGRWRSAVNSCFPKSHTFIQAPVGSCQFTRRSPRAGLIQQIEKR